MCLSVRTGLELLLEALALPSGEEVLVSAITHPDMVGIIESHGLVVVPVDLHTETLTPRRESLEAMLSHRSRLLLVAHLFGGRMDLTYLADFATDNELLLVEDRAQSFSGPEAMRESRADVSMYSFGQIKTATALGDAVLRVEDPQLLSRMRAANRELPIQPRREYLVRLSRLAGLMLATHPFLYGLLARACDIMGKDLDVVVGGAVRGFAHTVPDSLDQFLRRFRRRPSAPLLALLARRLRTFDATRLAQRARTGEMLARRLPTTLSHPGRSAASRTHWLFSVVASDPNGLVRALRSEGFDASRATSNIAVVEAPPHRPELEPTAAKEMMRNVVFLPAYPELPDAELERMAEILKMATAYGPRGGAASSKLPGRV